MATLLDSSGMPITGKTREKIIREQLKKSRDTREDDK